MGMLFAVVLDIVKPVPVIGRAGGGGLEAVTGGLAAGGKLRRSFLDVEVSDS